MSADLWSIALCALATLGCNGDAAAAATLKRATRETPVSLQQLGCALTRGTHVELST